MSFFRSHRRATVVLLSLSFLAVTTKGLCVMPSGANGKAEAHACCKKGWQVGTPSCCVENGTGGAAAKLTPRVVAPSPEIAVRSALWVMPLATAPSSRLLDAEDSVHSPPPTPILRV